MKVPDFSEWRELCEKMRGRKEAAFPFGSIVSVNSDRFHGLGIVARDENCPLEKVAVLVESLNVWWYPIEDCKPHLGPMSYWMRGYMRSRKIRRAKGVL